MVIVSFQHQLSAPFSHLNSYGLFTIDVCTLDRAGSVEYSSGQHRSASMDWKCFHKDTYLCSCCQERNDWRVDCYMSHMYSAVAWM